MTPAIRGNIEDLTVRESRMTRAEDAVHTMRAQIRTMQKTQDMLLAAYHRSQGAQRAIYVIMVAAGAAAGFVGAILDHVWLH